MIEDKHYLLRDYAIGEKHALALQVTRWREDERQPLDVSFKITRHDHAGIHVHFELFGYYSSFSFYSRHHHGAQP